MTDAHALPTADELLAEARAATDIAIDDTDAREPLTRLVAAFNDEGALHRAGVAAMHGRLVRILSNRLRMKRDFAAHPEIADQRIDRPIIICGMARTGSTKLQKLLAATGDFNWLPYWQVLNPSLLGGDKGEDPAPRIQDTEEFTQWFDAMSPETRSGHAFMTHEPEEESFLLEHSLRSPVFMGWAPIGSYLDWLMTGDMMPQFAMLRDMLKYLQWQGLADPARRWVLKSPLYSGMEPLLLAVFPDANLLMTHRHPAQSLPSGMRLLECFYRPFTDAKVDPARFVEGSAMAIDAHLQVRAALPPATFLDLPLDSLVGDIEATLKRIYAFIGAPLSPDALRAALDWDAANPRHKHGRHRYSLDDYGLTGEQVAHRFERYIALEQAVSNSPSA